MPFSDDALRDFESRTLDEQIGILFRMIGDLVESQVETMEEIAGVSHQSLCGCDGCHKYKLDYNLKDGDDE